MLLLIEIMFLAVGLWALVSGRLPTRLFRILFGKGEYALPPSQARLYGALLASPIPVALVATFLLAVVFGEQSTGMAVAFEYVYLVAVIVASIVIARRTRRLPDAPSAEPSALAGPSPGTKRSYGTRLLIIACLAVLSCITFTGLASLIMMVVSIFTVGTQATGDFTQDVLPFIVLIAVTALGLLGIVRLAKLLRK